MLTTDLDNVPHPEDLLGAYALDILDQAETLRVESHLEACIQCSDAVAGLRITAAVLGQSVGHSPVPASLQARVLDALPRGETEPDYVGSSPAAASVARPGGGLVRRLVPVAAILVLGLISYNLVMNFFLSSRMDDLQRENATLSRLVQLAAYGFPAEESQDQLRIADYWLADSASQPMILEPPDRSGESQGILLVTDDGRRAMLMVAGLRELPPPSSYQVWLLRQGQELWVGQLKVDSNGWGTVTLYPEEPLFGFDTVRLTPDPAAGVGKAPKDMILEGQIIAQKLTK